MHNEELNNLYSFPSKIRMIKSRRMRLTGHVAHMRRRGIHIQFPRESEKPLGKPSRRWEEILNLYLGEIGSGGYGLD
jgi:hypothetical protein